MSGYLHDLSEVQQEALIRFKESTAHYNLDPKKYDDSTLLRFLRARKFDLDKTQEMFDKYMNWRQEYDTDNIFSFSFPEIIQMKTFYPQGYHKTDREGHPIYIERLGKLEINRLFEISNEERLMRFFVREYERLLLEVFPACSKAAGKRIENTLVILDLSGVSLKHMNRQVFNLVKSASSITQDYYPEILGKMFIVNTPSLFSMVWNTVKGFIDEKTRSKIEICGSNFGSKLGGLVDHENLPDFLGGGCSCARGCLLQNIGPWNPEGFPTDDTGAVIWPEVKIEEEPEVEVPNFMAEANLVGDSEESESETSEPEEDENSRYEIPPYNVCDLKEEDQIEVDAIVNLRKSRGVVFEVNYR